ncbi:hypothetical protein BCS42_14310 [Crenothrix sp. D3]|jgi:hypothetical protein|nr:hypothetical protein BCS42_14310 [Crenothrix sp. D3]
MLSTFIKSLNRHQWVSESAYYKALARGVEPNKELDDWLAAERDYLTMLIDLQLHILEEDGTVSTMGLRQIAESLGVEHPELMRSELTLIRAIQEASYHYPCFRSTNSTFCKEVVDCQWSEKCRKIVAIWHR